MGVRHRIWLTIIFMDISPARSYPGDFRSVALWYFATLTPVNFSAA